MAVLAGESLPSRRPVILTENSGIVQQAILYGFLEEEFSCCLHSDTVALLFYDFSPTLKH